MLCCGYILTDFPISIRLTSLTLWQSNDCPSASKATLMNMDKYFMWIHYEWLHNHNKAKHNKTVCIFLGIYCTSLGLNAFRQPNSNGRGILKEVSLDKLVPEKEMLLISLSPWSQCSSLVPCWFRYKKNTRKSKDLKMILNATTKWHQTNRSQSQTWYQMP